MYTKFVICQRDNNIFRGDTFSPSKVNQLRDWSNCFSNDRCLPFTKEMTVQVNEFPYAYAV